MIKFITKHKTIVIIACAAVVVGVSFALLAHSFLPKQNAKEEVPPGRIHDAGVFGEDIVVHDSTEGEIIIGAKTFDDGAEIVPLSAPLKIASSPDEIWMADTYAGNHTPTEKAQMKNGSIGVLTIPKLNLSVNVYESPDNMEAMLKGVAHFPSTSAFDSNVGLSAHNVNMDGSDGYFKNLHTLEKGDTITYMTALGERSYVVSGSSIIAASDWTPLSYTDDNRLTMITCISGQPDKRLSVVAIEAPKQN